MITSERKASASKVEPISGTKRRAVCYAGQTKPVDQATAGIAGGFDILYMLTQGQWSSFAPNRPDLTTITELQPYDSVLVLVTQEGGATWSFGP